MIDIVGNLAEGNGNFCEGCQECPDHSNHIIVVLYVQEVVTHLYCNLLYKMGHYIMDIKYINFVITVI